jgi:phage shock protein PspC (stress-responsive transcriptional regulator)
VIVSDIWVLGIPVTVTGTRGSQGWVRGSPDCRTGRVRQDGRTMSEIAADIRSLRRPRDTRLIGGLCSAISSRFGVDVLIVRVLAVLAMAFTSAMPVVYLLGLMLVPAAAEVLSANGTFVRTRRRRRQLFAYVLLLGAADSLFDNKMPTNKVFAVALIVGGLLLMHLRSRTLNAQSTYVPAPSEGGWTATPGQAVPPRWGLAGEVANPQLWNPQPGIDPTRAPRQSVWQTQFGNLALVTLVGVLAIGLWSNTSKSSPVRRAAILERLAVGPVSVDTKEELAELADLNLGNGSFVIDMSMLTLDDDEDLSLSMGAGRLELIVPPGVDVEGSIDTDSSRSAAVVVRSFGTNATAPTELSLVDSATRQDPFPVLTLDIEAEAGFVCLRSGTDERTSGPSDGCDNGSTVPTTATPPPPPAPLAKPSPPAAPSTLASPRST